MMRRLLMATVVLVGASLLHVDGISLSPIAAQDRVATVLGAARKALGGEDKIAGVKTLTAEGPFRRTMGPRDMEGTASVTLARPDKFKRVEEMQMGGMVGGLIAGDLVVERGWRAMFLVGGGLLLFVENLTGGLLPYLRYILPAAVILVGLTLLLSYFRHGEETAP